MRKKHVLLPAIALMFAVFCTGCTSQPDNKQLNNEQFYESFLYESDFPNFVGPYDWSVISSHDELLEAFNIIANYWDANPYCGIRNAIVVLRYCVPDRRIRVGLDSDSEELRVAFRTHILDSRAISLSHWRGISTPLPGHAAYSRSIYFGTEASRLSGAWLYDGQQECFTFAELLDAVNLVGDFLLESWHSGQAYEIRKAVSFYHLCAINNRVRVSLLGYSEEVKEDFRAKVTDSPAVLLMDFRRGT